MVGEATLSQLLYCVEPVYKVLSKNLERLSSLVLSLHTRSRHFEQHRALYIISMYTNECNDITVIRPSQYSKPIEDYPQFTNLQ